MLLVTLDIPRWMLLKCTFILFLASFVESIQTSIRFNKTSVEDIRAKDGDYPYVAFISGPNGICTGAILERRWVLTAAHCIGNVSDVNSVKVMTGSYDWMDPDALNVTALSVITHPNYEKGRTLQGDLALIKIPPLRFVGNLLRPIQVTNETWYGRAKDCETMGFGRLWQKSKVVHGLFALDVTAKRGRRGCSCMSKSQKEQGVCLNRNSFRGSCMWDTGGPLVCDNRLVGVYHTTIDKLTCSKLNPRAMPNCRAEETFEVFTYTCPNLSWMGKYIPSLPLQPLYCRASYLAATSTLFTLPLLFFWLKI